MINTVSVDTFEFQYDEENYINFSKLCKSCSVEPRTLIKRNAVKDYITQLDSSGTKCIRRQIGGNSNTQGLYTSPNLTLYLVSLLNNNDLYDATKSFIEKHLKVLSTEQETPSIVTLARSRTVQIGNYSFQCRDDEYVNLTKMCNQAGKKLKRFLEQEDTKAKLQALQSKVDLSDPHVQTKKPLIEKRVGGTPSEQGTYGHPLVALFLAQWLSPEFAVAMAQLAQSYFKADVSLATNILERATPEQVNTQGEQLANVLVEKADVKTEAHIQARLNTKNTNRELNKALADCPNVSRGVFAMAQDAIYKASYGKAIKTIKKEKGLDKQDSIRDTLTTRELVHLAFCESLSAEVLDNTKPSGDINCSKSVYNTSKQVKEFAKKLTNNNE